MLKITHLNKSYTEQGGSKLTIFKDFNLEVKKGEFIGIFGPNGCGKTTLLNLIAGLDRPNSGSIIFNTPAIKTAVIFQNYRESLFPLFLLIFGIGDGSKIATAVFVSLWIILINSAYGVLYSSKLRQKVGFTLGANRFQIFRDIVVMDALPQVFVGLRTALSISLVVVVVSEMFIGSKFGLGQKIFDAYLTYETTKLYAILLITGSLGYALNKIFVAFEKKIVHWAGK